MFVCPECGHTQPAAGFCPVDGTHLPPRGDDVLVGTMVGVYRVARLLGVGGMGRVYKGVHPTIGSRVAIKVLSRECADRPDLVERFFSEARAVNVIRHESLVNVLDLAVLPDGRPFIIMEYLDGAPLAALIEKGGPMPLGGLARLATELLDGLGAAHAAGIVHRDLKPDNIFVTPGGRGKILDFGIAKLRPELSGGSATRTGSLLGTPHYMAPEQAMSRTIDARTDIYAFGVILFEAATGRRPFDSESLFDLLRKHVDEPPPPPRAFRPDMPASYEQVILHALAKDPAHRFASTQALAHALMAAAQELPSEQWMPVTPSTAAQLAAQRTPMSGPGSGGPWPPSWTPGSSKPPTTPERPAALAAQQGAPTPPSMSHGQMVSSRTQAGSRQAAWFLFGVLAVGGVGAGIAVAVMHDDPPTRSSEPATEPVAATAVDAAAVAQAVPSDAAPAVADARTATSASTATRPARPVLAEKPDPEPDAAPPSKPSRPTSGQDWIALQQSLTRDVDLPSGWNPASFDVAGYLPAAQAAVRKVYPDAVLYRIDADGVRPDGRADLTLADDFYVDYRFISPAMSKRPDDVPLGVKVEEKCILRVWVDDKSIEVRPITGWKCDEVPVPKPRCSPAQIWQKAIKKGAPQNAVGELGYRATFSKKAVWYFSIEGTSFSEIIQDDC